MEFAWRVQRRGGCNNSSHRAARSLSSPIPAVTPLSSSCTQSASYNALHSFETSGSKLWQIPESGMRRRRRTRNHKIRKSAMG